MERRALLKATAAIGALAGCLSSSLPGERPSEGQSPTADETPLPDPPACTDPERPEYEGENPPVEVVAYPETSPAVDATAEMLEYMAAYERAYRTHALLEEYGRTLESVSVGVEERRSFHAPSGSAIGRVRYNYGYQRGSVHSDSPTIRASYYVDASVVARAAARGPSEDETALDPNPLTEGDVVECFSE